MSRIEKNMININYFFVPVVYIYIDIVSFIYFLHL